MSLTRRLAAGLPAAGVTVLAALALTGSPAAATGDESAARAKPAVMSTPCSAVPRGTKCDYADDTPAGNAAATPDDSTPGGAAPTSGGYGPTPGGAGPTSGGYRPTPGGNGATPDDNGAGPTRGNAGYGGESPTPGASVDTVPPGGESPATSPSPSKTTGGAVSAGGTLPLTGAPMGLTIALGGLMVASGAAVVFFTRRRRSA